MDMNVATLSRSSSTAERNVEPRDASAPASAGAFEAVLATLQGSSVISNVEASAPAASEVFEQPAADPRRHRMETMRNDARQSDLRGEGPGAPDRAASLKSGDLQDASAAGRDESLRHETSGGTVNSSSPASAPPTAASTDAHATNTPAPAQVRQSAWNSDRAMESGGASRGSGENRAQSLRSPGALQPSSAASNQSSIAASSGGGAVAERIAQWISQPGAGEAKAQGPASAVAPAGPTAGAARSAESSPPTRARDAAKPGETPTPQSSGPARDFEKLVHSIRLQQNGSRSRATLDLKPAELGRVRIEASMEDGRLELVIQTQTAEAREVLGGRLAELREALQQQGVQPGAFELAPWNAEESSSWIAGGGESADRRGETAAPFEGETEQVGVTRAPASREPKDPATGDLATMGVIAPVDGRWDIRA
ncbi:MAG: flagellar hook-length control protein FliK [Phycisphaerales bacterium]|nr:flagellar hook-length control protein FliK [Phycisphaerales bacterium]